MSGTSDGGDGAGAGSGRAAGAGRRRRAAAPGVAARRGAGNGRIPGMAEPLGVVRHRRGRSPVAMTVTRTSPCMAGSLPAPKMISASSPTASWMISLICVASPSVRSSPPVMLMQHAGRAGDRDVVEQRARDGLLRGLHGAVLAAADAGAHQRRAAVLHDGAHVGEVHVDDAGRGDEAGDALRGVQQHLVGLLERVLERDPLPDDREQALVRARRSSCPRCLRSSAMPISACRIRFRPSNRNGLVTMPTVSAPMSRASCGDDRRRAGAGAAAHAAGHEDQVGPLERRDDLVAVLLDRLPADLGPRAGARARASASSRSGP